MKHKELEKQTQARRLVRSLARAAIIQTHEQSGRFRRIRRVFANSTRNQRIIASTLLLFFVASTAVYEIQPFMEVKETTLTKTAQALLPETSKKFAERIKIDKAKGTFEFNQGTAPMVDKSNTGEPRISAAASQDASKGLKVTDPLNKVDFTLKPLFKTELAKQDENRISYKLKGVDGFLVYTIQAGGVKEDIILNRFIKDKLTFDYQLEVPDGAEARLEQDGSIGVYGSSLGLSGDVSTGSEQDAALLQKARAKAAKDKLLYTIPAPFVKENGKQDTKTRTTYNLQGNKLTVTAENLRDAQYPLTIDPSVYVESAQQFMRGNNESNIDFDVSNQLIQKGGLTGARINSWSTSMVTPAARFGQGTAVMSGYMYVVGGTTGTPGNNSNVVYWSKIDGSNYTLTSPNPGNGACANWCTNTAYNLPAARGALTLVAYSGYLYAIGGTNTGNVRQNTVYYAKVGSNGEPISWTAATNLSVERSNTSAVAYNNKMYLLGGQTTATTNGITTVEYADINPDGSLGAWSTTGMTALTSARWGHTALQYNGYMYLVGGSSTTTVAATVEFAKIAADGTIGAWTTSAQNFTTARAGYGGSFATISGGYMYINGGCSVVTVNGCTTVIASDELQLASINADGSVSDFTSITGVTQTKTGHGFVAWRNTLYQIGGCTVMSGVNCTTALTTTNYARVNGDGDVSPTSTEPSQPTRGNAAGQVGRTAMGVVINNGYIYNIGGCANDACSTMSDNTGYAPINSDGTIGTWLIDSTDSVNNAAAGLAAFGITVYNNTVYLIGGSNNAYVNTYTKAVFNADGTVGTWTTGVALAGYTASGHSYVISRTNNGTTGDLYIIGGCGGTTGIGCTAGSYRTTVLRCTITNSTGLVSACATTGQLQLATGLGLMAGIYYANYIYLAGGADATGAAQTDTVYFATINASGNIVRVDNGNATGGWQTTSTLPRIRRRGVAVGINGYIYVIGGHDGSGAANPTLSDISYAKIDQTTGQLGAFTSSVSTITPRWNEGAAAANGYVYIVGGCTFGPPPASCANETVSPFTPAMSGVVESIQIYNNYSGSPRSFTTAANQFATDTYGSSAAIINGYIYKAGGCTTATECTTASNIVTHAPLNADGSIGTWTVGTALGAARYAGSLVAMNGTLYYMGGETGGVAQTTVYHTVPNPSTGAITSWLTTSSVLPAAKSGLSAAVFNNRIYATGGSASTTVYYSNSLPSGGAVTSWTSTTAFPINRSGHTTIAYGSALYILGGYDGTNYLSDVRYAPINSDGTIGSWVLGTNLPQAVRQGDGFASNGFMYLFGGRSAAAGCTNNTYVAPINANGSIGYWSQTNVKFTTQRFGAASAYSGGRAYILGGYNCVGAAFTGAQKAVYTSLQFQPHIANYSIAIDTDSNVFPTKFLANGLDNADGARWYLNYKSSLQPPSGTPTWGQNTNYGAVSLGVPGTYTPIDGAGANTNRARWYYLALTIDSQNAFGYPEDVTRGPNIYDLSLFFSADPAKRLIHGKTFTDGQQQPLDTPF